MRLSKLMCYYSIGNRIQIILMGRKEINPHGGKVYLFLDNLGKTATVHKTRAVSAPYPIPLSTTQDIFHLQFPYPPPEDKAIDLQWMS